MRDARPLRLAWLALAVLSTAGTLSLLHASAAPAAAQAPDNSAQDQGAAAESPADLRADRMTLAQVRRAIAADKTLSTNAHNIKILVVNGTVTLKGPVNSDDERQKVFADVANVVSPDKIANQLTLTQ